MKSNKELNLITLMALYNSLNTAILQNISSHNLPLGCFDAKASQEISLFQLESVASQNAVSH